MEHGNMKKVHGNVVIEMTA